MAELRAIETREAAAPMRRRIPISAMRIDRPSFEARLLSAYAVIYVALSALTGLVVARHPMPLLGAARFNHDLTYAAGFKLFALLIVPLSTLLLLGYRPADLLLTRRPTPLRTLTVVTAFGIGFSLNLEHLANIAGAAHAHSSTQLALRVCAGALLPLFTAAIPEEVVYRGLLQSRLEATLGRLAAVTLTALLFTAWHIPARYFLSQGVEGRAGDLASVLAGTGIPVLIVGLTFGLLWDRYRNLPTLIAAHWGIDVLPSISSFLGVRF